ncbi:MAG: YkgJ family cysteine cluster protein [Thermoplasmatota archaeon]
MGGMRRTASGGPRPHIDASELEGLALECPEGCAYCCLCPPELEGAELEHFRSSRPGSVERRWESMHLALQGGSGACVVLSGGRCMDYARRPFHCRAFPVRVHFSYRAQACANLSCRGVIPLPPEGSGVSKGELGSPRRGRPEIVRARASLPSSRRLPLSTGNREGLREDGDHRLKPVVAHPFLPGLRAGASRRSS